MNIEHPPAMQSAHDQNNNYGANINVISATENLHKGIAGRSNVQHPPAMHHKR
ncbi:MAG: hypothetical protein U9R02_08645 [Thermodesulfobacteriota bacterium]|nr:hypothetical protein [Thermodesulfobacteriota bacterium]